MRYTVRSPDGELDFPSRKDLFGAYQNGLVAEDDEVREEGSTTWRKAEAVLGTRLNRATATTRTMRLRVSLLTVLGCVSLFLITRGDTARVAMGWTVAIALVVWMYSWTRDAFALKRRR